MDREIKNIYGNKGNEEADRGINFWNKLIKDHGKRNKLYSLFDR